MTSPSHYCTIIVTAFGCKDDFVCNYYSLPWTTPQYSWMSKYVYIVKPARKIAPCRQGTIGEWSLDAHWVCSDECWLLSVVKDY